MIENEQLDARYRSIAWGALFILVGTLNLVPGDQTDIALLAAGAVFITLNLLRLGRGMPMGGFSLTLGVIAFALGTLLLLRAQLGLHIEVEVLPLILIAVGVYCLLPSRAANPMRCC
jgi:hypothetical protein